MATPASIPPTSLQTRLGYNNYEPKGPTNNQKPDKRSLINAKHTLLLPLDSSACYIIKELVAESREEREEK